MNLYSIHVELPGGVLVKVWCYYPNYERARSEAIRMAGEDTKGCSYRVIEERTNETKFCITGPEFKEKLTVLKPKEDPNE